MNVTWNLAIDAWWRTPIADKHWRNVNSFKIKTNSVARKCICCAHSWLGYLSRPHDNRLKICDVSSPFVLPTIGATTERQKENNFIIYCTSANEMSKYLFLLTEILFFHIIYIALFQALNSRSPESCGDSMRFATRRMCTQCTRSENPHSAQ